MNDIEINDIRRASDFKSISFSSYKTTAVIKELLNSMINCKIEYACNWSAELICAGHYSELWNTILIFIGKHIHLGNPKLPIYIETRFNKFKEILSNGYLDNELTMRNNEKIRKLFAEIICVLCFSKKKHSIDPIKIKTEDEFDITNMASKFKAPSIDFANESFLKDDPKELFIPINELAYNISVKSKDTIAACKWIEWIIEFERLCKKRKEKCCCERRIFAPVQEKFQMDIVWLIWDVLLKETMKRNNDLCKRIIMSTLNIFCIKYTPAVKKRRRFLMYFVVGLLTEEVNYKIELIPSDNKDEIDKIVSKINVIYKQIKQNEEKPQTEYLFNDVGKTNLEKTIERLDKMKELNSFVPKIE